MALRTFELGEWVEKQDGIIAKLLPLGMAALEAEDRRLALAFQQCPVPPDFTRERKDSFDVAHGLSYQVYEHILQYELFKAWLPLARVDWDAAYEGGGNTLLDLCVHAGGRVLAFELKWWGNNSNRVTTALAADIRRLRDHPTAHEKYLLCFWWGGMPHWEADEDGARQHSFQGAALVFVSRFRTKGPQQGDFAGDRYFSMAAFRVAPVR